jgi:hypothetical protein
VSTTHGGELETWGTLEGMEEPSLYYKFDMLVLVLACLSNSYKVAFGSLSTQNLVLLKFALSSL